MAGDWIKMRNDLADDPAVIDIAGRLELDEFAVVGRLHTLWAWADEQSRDGHARGVTSAWLDRKVQRDGFASALVSVGWLEAGADGLRFPNFDHHNGATAKTRALGTRRKQQERASPEPDPVAPAVTPKSRTVSANCHAATVTKARPEKRREEKIEKRGDTPLKPPAAWMPPDWVPARQWTDFEAMRKAMRGVPFTDAARDGVVRELDKFRAKGHDPATLLAHAVTNGHRTVYEPRMNGGKAPPRDEESIREFNAKANAEAARILFGDKTHA